MSKFEFRLPDIGEGVAEGEIVNWLVNDGDKVEENQDMVEVMTDKATVTIGAPKSGVIAERRAKVGDTVPVGSVLVVFDLGGEAGAEPARPAESPQPKPPTEKPPTEKTEKTAAPPTTMGGDEDKDVVFPVPKKLPGMEEEAPRGQASSNEKPLASPATRQFARENGIDLRQVRGSGPAGRITREDVEKLAAGGKPAAPVEATAPAETATAPAVAAAPPVAAKPNDERQPIRGLRKKIFENMARSKHTAAHFTYVDECDAGALKALRERCKPHAEAEQIKLSFLPFIVKAVVAALKKHPALNAAVDEAKREIVLRKTYDIGIAVATPAGLIVPVVRDADRRSILEIAREIERVSGDARIGKSKAEDLGGSSFTITSLGKLGGLFATPVINHPEVAILGVHEMKRRPVVKGDQIVIGEVMLLSLSFDHRIIDGDVGATFAQEVIGFLEEPDRMFCAI